MLRRGYCSGSQTSSATSTKTSKPEASRGAAFGDQKVLAFGAMSALNGPPLRVVKFARYNGWEPHGSARREAGSRCRKSVPCSQRGQRAVGADRPAEDPLGVGVEYVQEAAVTA
jgi:hypothetical protein